MVTEQCPPYAVIGIGFFNLSTSGKITFTYRGVSQTEDLSSLESEENAFLTSFGVGLDIPAGEKAKVFIEARYAIGFTEGQKTQYVPVRVGVKLKL